MATYTRLGTYLLANDLATDPFGKVHRGLVNLGSAFDRHLLIRTFSDEIENTGFGAKIADANRILPLLGSARGFGSGYRIEGGKAPYVVCDYLPGRSLAQLLEKTKQEQIPLGVDHALTVLQSVAQAIVHMHAKGLSHGILTPHSIWVSFEGATQILDAPYAAILKGVLPKAKIAEVSISRYTRDTGGNLLQEDFFALGAILYELLTLDKLPAHAEIPGALSRATLKAAQDEAPVPPEILSLLSRLLMVGPPFEDVNAFNSELERVLYDGDYSPTTFNMAFFMHTLFREENEEDTQAMKADQAADFTPFVMMDAGIGAGASINEGQKKNLVKFAIWGGAIAAGLVGIMGYMTYKANQRTAQLQKDLSDIQNQYYNEKANLQTLDQKAEEARKKVAEADKKAKEAKTRDEREKARIEAEKAKAEQAKIDADTQAAKERVRQLEEKTQKIQQAAGQKPSTPPPAAGQGGRGTQTTMPETPATPVPSGTATRLPSPTPAPTQPTPTPTQPSPAPETPDTAPAAAAPSVPDAPVRILESPAAAYPAAALSNPSVSGQDNVVRLRVFVDENGKPLKVMIDQGVPGSYGFDDNAKEAALRSRFQPAIKGGKPAKDWVTLSVRFPKRR